MSDRQRKTFNLSRRLHSVMCGRRLCVRSLSIAGAFVLLVTLFFAFRTPSSTDTQSMKGIAPPPERRVRLTPQSVFDSEAFYQTIISNNLFRPLGWTPPHPTEPYRLIGTILPRDANMPPQAILESIAGNKTYIVSTGEKLDASTEVVSIQGKAVTLSTNGEQRTLRLNTTVYLNPSPANRYAARRSPAP